MSKQIYKNKTKISQKQIKRVFDKIDEL